MGREPGDVDGSPAKIRTDGTSIDALYAFRGPGDKDHLIAHDGENVNYLREHGKEVWNDEWFVRDEKRELITRARDTAPNGPRLL